MQSLWLASSPQTNFPPLSGDLDTDVAIVGGGITGITAAWLLKNAGRRVAIIEARRVAEGETGHTTAHVTALQDLPFPTIAARFGQDGARRIASAGMAAIALIEQHVRTCSLDCDFERLPAYVFTEDPNRLAELDREVKAARRAGLDAERVDAVPLPFETAGGIRFEHQARFHVRHYVLPLASRVHGDGSFVFERTHAIEVNDGSPCVIHTDRGTIRARQVIAATNAVTVNRLFLQTKIAPYRTYAIALSVGREMGGLFYDTEDPYHYIRTHPTEEGPLLIVGGADHRVGERSDTATCYQELEAWARRRFGPAPVAYRWSGQIQEPVDGLPYVGRNPHSENVYVATGYSGNGMVNGTVAAMVLSDLVLGRENPWAELLSARRIKPLASAKAFVVENADFPKNFVKDRLPAKLPSVEEVRRGEGRVVRAAGRRVAAYRDESGELHALSPVCPHMGCLVHWNEEARSWDCPCHGSRFDAMGAVIHGPATRGLTTLDVAEGEDEAPAAHP